MRPTQILAMLVWVKGMPGLGHPHLLHELSGLVSNRLSIYIDCAGVEKPYVLQGMELGLSNDSGSFHIREICQNEI